MPALPLGTGWRSTAQGRGWGGGGGLKKSPAEMQPSRVKSECVYGHSRCLYFNHFGLKIITL